MNLPSRNLEDKQVFTAICLDDASLSFSIVAHSETFAKTELLDKVGYMVTETPAGTFQLVDADDPSMVDCALEATALVAAIDEAVVTIGWKLGEPTQMIGGTMGSGFGFEEQ